MSNTDGLTLLGSGKTDYPTEYTPRVLERISSPFVGEVQLDCPEFTSLCPRTAQPDFACIVIRYEPRGWLVESKALKLYLFSFRNHGSFHEDCVNMIADDLVKLLEPKWLEVVGHFNPRGGISIVPRAFRGVR